MSRRRRGRQLDRPSSARGDAAAAARIVRGLPNRLSHLRWFAEECSALDDDVAEFTDAVAHRRLGDAWDVAKRRSGLIVGVAVPALVLLRFPGAAVWVLRGAVPLITGVVGVVAQVVLRNPRLPAGRAGNQTIQWSQLLAAPRRGAGAFRNALIGEIRGRMDGVAATPRVPRG